MDDIANTALRFLGYTRKSSEDNKERQAASLPEQLYVLEGIKAKHNLTLVEILQESKSAHKPGREIFNNMLARIESGEANAILTWHPNRLCRNALDAGQLLYLMDENKLVEIRTPSRTYRNTPEDKFMLTLEFGISKKDSDDKSIVVERGLEKKARDGWRPGVAPQGYLNDRLTESGFRKILTDPERLPFIKKIFELFHGGTSVVEIHRIAKDEWKFRSRQKKRSGGKPLSLSMIYKILTNPFYCGKFEYPEGSGKWYEGQHEKAISEEIFDEIQVKLGRRSQYKLQHQNFAYSALMRCGNCDSGIVAEQKWQCICKNCKLKFSLTKNNKEKCTGCGTLIKNMANPTILHYIYYRCGRKKNPNCRERAIRVDGLEEQIDSELSQIEISPLFVDWAVRQIIKDNQQERNFREDTITNIKQAHDDCRKKLDNLLQLKISPSNMDGSLLSDEQYKFQKEDLETELKNLSKQLSGMDDRMIQANDQTEKAFTFAARARARFATGDNKIKRDIFMGFGLHLTLQDKTVRFDAPKYINTIKEMMESEPIIADRVAPRKEPDFTHEMENYYASIPTLLRGRESRPA
ncbi:recombinase family protein [Candidatus Microgenomates bacterium]|nr:recombinase family protein [Candidatus Microgenomates bacterium]